MLTCTVSMIETAIAIIATCLPALRSMILGANTTKDSSHPNTYGRHDELSNAQSRANESRLHPSHVSSGQVRRKANGSEDSLFSDGELQDVGELMGPGKGGITVDTRIETRFDDSQSTRSSAKGKSPFS